jgi:hypothetical protein
LVALLLQRLAPPQLEPLPLLPVCFASLCVEGTLGTLALLLLGTFLIYNIILDKNFAKLIVKKFNTFIVRSLGLVRALCRHKFDGYTVLALLAS